VVGPRVGKQVFTLSDVSLSEPDPALFELPEGYTVLDHRTQQPRQPQQPVPDR